MMKKDLFDQTAAGMHTLYDSDAFVVVHMQADAPAEGGDAGPEQQEHPALARHGFEIVDKRSGKQVYLDGSWAEQFQQQIFEWQHHTPTQEEVEDALEHYSGLGGATVMLH